MLIKLGYITRRSSGQITRAGFRFATTARVRLQLKLKH
jgi:hypothetical protein